MKYNNIEITWDDEIEKFTATINNEFIESVNLNTIKKRIDLSKAVDSHGYLIDGWHSDKRVHEVEILRKSGDKFSCRNVGYHGRGRLEWKVYKKK